MNKKSELNKYDKKTLELQKKLCFIQNRAEKDYKVVYGELRLNICFPSYEKNRDNFCIF